MARSSALVNDEMSAISQLRMIEQPQQMINPSHDSDRFIRIEVVAKAVSGAVAVEPDHPPIDFHRASLLLTVLGKADLRSIGGEGPLHERRPDLIRLPGGSLANAIFQNHARLAYCLVMML